MQQLAPSPSSVSWIWSMVEYTGEVISDLSQRAGRFAKKHKTALIVTGVISGATIATIYGVYYVKWRVQEYQEQHLNKIRLQNYFERAQQTCDTTILTMIPTLIGQLDEIVDIPTPDMLRSSRHCSKEEKLALWDSCKILTFTKVITAAYAVVHLVVILRIQVNVVARYLFLESLIKQENASGVPAQVVLTPEVQKRYLSYSEYCITIGLRELAGKVREVVENVLKNYPLQRQCSMEDLMSIFDQVRRTLEDARYGKNRNEPLTNTFLLPPERKDERTALLDDDDQNLEKKKLQLLLNETRDIIESDRFNQVTKGCVTTAFFDVMKHLHSSFEQKACLQKTDLEDQEKEAQLRPAIPMANLLPQVKKQLDVVLNPRPNPFLDAIACHTLLSDYSFDILTSFGQVE